MSLMPMDKMMDAANEKDIQERERRIDADKRVKNIGVDFPVSAFPVRMQEFINGYCDVYGSSPDHYGLTLLTVAGAVIGNACWVEERNNTHPPLLYSIIVDYSSAGKSPIMKTCLSPIWKIEKEMRHKHADLLRSLKDQDDDSKDKMPPPKEMILGDFTIESVYQSLYANPRGVLVFRHELNGWLGSMGRYNSGSEEEFYLETWDGSTQKISRKKSPIPIFIDRPFIPILGGTQPDVIQKFANGSKMGNGFLARFLVSWPEVSLKADHHNKCPDPSHMEYWEGIIRKLQGLPVDQKDAEDEFSDFTVNPHFISLDTKAQAAYTKFFNRNAELIRKSDDETERSIRGKFESYLLRIALILEMIEWVDGFKSAPTLDDVYMLKISETSVKNAERLVNYFEHTALKVVNRVANPAEALPADQHNWYKNLPNDRIFTRAEALRLAKRAGVKPRTMARLLSNEKLFLRKGQGLYETKWLIYDAEK